MQTAAAMLVIKVTDGSRKFRRNLWKAAPCQFQHKVIPRDNEMMIRFPGVTIQLHAINTSGWYRCFIFLQERSIFPQR